ncbi:MAG: elongation factor G [Candidatus Omnitrophica bacterium]|nr:elongation factor G [Candidatus Omnitrophota bacterium]
MTNDVKMAEYTTDKIRNIILLGHSGAGKTSLIEAMLFKAGMIKEQGTIAAGTTVGDYNPDEIERKTTINSKILNINFNGARINIIDTPGFADFIGDVLSGLAAADAALLIVDATSGIQVGTERSWALLEEKNLPRMIFINKTDKENADLKKTIDSVVKKFGKRCIQISANFTESQIEMIAESDDKLLEKFLESGKLADEEVKAGLAKAIMNGKIVPILSGSAVEAEGVEDVLDFIVNYFPPPKVSEGPFSALVFKTIIDPYIGQISVFKIFSGELNSESTIFNSTKNQRERIGQILQLQGKATFPKDKAIAGDIVAVAKLKITQTGDTLCDEKKPIQLPPLKFPEAAISFSIKPKSRGDEDKILSSLTKLSFEDPSLQIIRDAQTKELVVCGLGDLHLDIMINRLKSRFNVDVEIGTPKVAYKETITTQSDSQYRHKKQTGGAGQFAEVWMRIEPLPQGRGFEFVDEVVGGAIPAPFIVSCEKGIRSIMETGILAGYPITDVRAVVYDGKTHPVDSKDIAFQIAARSGFKEAFLKAKPILLEPIMDVEIIAPEEYMGSITGTISSKRGRISGVEANVVKAKMPLAEMFKYASELKSITSGRASYTMRFSHYEEVPAKIAQTIIAQAKLQKQEEREE